MTISLDDATANLECPKCGHQISETIGRLKQQNELTCPACGAGFTVSLEKVRAFEAEATDFFRSIGARFDDDA